MTIPENDVFCFCFYPTGESPSAATIFTAMPSISKINHEREAISSGQLMCYNEGTKGISAGKNGIRMNSLKDFHSVVNGKRNPGIEIIINPQVVPDSL
jgi:hypothetical protein